LSVACRASQGVSRLSWWHSAKDVKPFTLRSTCCSGCLLAQGCGGLSTVCIQIIHANCACAYTAMHLHKCRKGRHELVRYLYKWSSHMCSPRKQLLEPLFGPARRTWLQLHQEHSSAVRVYPMYFYPGLKYSKLNIVLPISVLALGSGEDILHVIGSPCSFSLRANGLRSC
jgi:hypothetical protein